ncbi:MAG: CYTH and CHAD domain-containing protein [Methylophilaceae bacterium]|nr:CYTH and CHAD domain-containing protein [Methylophilaceae bacterium]
MNEVELKLRIARADSPRLRHHPAITTAAMGKPITRKLTSIYYDTPDLRLLDSGISLRVRRMAGHWFQSLKAGGYVLAGLHQRKEWEDMIATEHPDFTRILDPELARLFADQSLRDALKPLFRTEVQRTEWQLVYDDGARIELALDLGRLIAGQKSYPISEVELELKNGHAGRLFDLALALQQDIPLELENVSKAQLGYGLFRPHQPAILKACPPELKRNQRAEEAFKTIAWECIRQLQGNLDMVLHGTDPEGVHQMRVALRRLRSALTVFRDVVGRESHQEIVAEIGWIMGLLGVARDLDVFLGETLPPMLDHLDCHPGLLKLQDKALSAQRRAYKELRQALVSQRYQRLLLTLGSWLENERWRAHTPQVESRSVRDIARVILAKRHRQLKRHGGRLRHMHPEERHATRIAAKKLRYAAEFFASLYETQKARRFIGRLAKLQDKLGALNDIAVTARLVTELAGSRPNRALDEAIHLLTGWNRCNAMHRMQDMDEAWDDFARLKPFWD